VRDLVRPSYLRADIGSKEIELRKDETIPGNGEPRSKIFSTPSPNIREPLERDRTAKSF